MSSMAWEQAVAAFEAVAEQASEASEVWTSQQRIDQLERIQMLERVLPALRHELINELSHAPREEIGGRLPHVLADRLRIYRRDARQMIEEAADLGPRTRLTGHTRAAPPGWPPPEQRLVLYALERGCTHPGCDVPACWCQVHHANKDWAKGGQTNIDELTLSCGPHNRDVNDGGWTTRKREDGTTEWIPPSHLDHGQRRTNSYFHPEKMMPDEEDDEDGH